MIDFRRVTQVFANFIYDRRATYLWPILLSGVWLWTLVWLSQQYGARAPFIVSDDGRHFVVWLRRLNNPDLFPGDPVADHFSALTPWLYTALFKPFSKIGIDPVATHLTFVTMLAGIAFSVSFYFLVLRLWSSHIGAAFAASLAPLVFSGYLMQGLPRSFGFAILFAALFGYLGRRVVFTGSVMLVGAGLYPASTVLVGIALAFLTLRRRFPFFSTEPRQFLTVLVAGLAAITGAYLFIQSADGLGPTYTLQEAKELRVFGPGGRNSFFDMHGHPRSLLCNIRAGLSPLCVDAPKVLQTAVAIISILFPFLVAFGIVTGRLDELTRKLRVPPFSLALGHVIFAILAASFLLFALAHMIAFRLHLPNRYGMYGIQLALALSMLPLISAFIVALTRHIFKRFGALSALVCLLFPFILGSQPILTSWFSLVSTTSPSIHTFLRTTPTDTLVAGISRELDNVPAFSNRSVFVAYELAISYKKNYHQMVDSRAAAIANALYTDKSDEFAELINRTGIDLVLIDRDHDRRARALDRWAWNFPAAAPAKTYVDSGKTPFYYEKLEFCTLAESQQHALLNADCLIAH